MHCIVAAIGIFRNIVRRIRRVPPLQTMPNIVVHFKFGTTRQTFPFKAMDASLWHLSALVLVIICIPKFTTLKVVSGSSEETFTMHIMTHNTNKVLLLFIFKCRCAVIYTRKRFYIDAWYLLS